MSHRLVTPSLPIAACLRLAACAGLASAVSAQTIDAVDPAVATRSGRIELTGSGFGSLPGSVRIDGFPALVAVWSETRIVGYVPERSALGPTALELATAGGSEVSVPFEVEPRASAGRERWRFAVEGDYLLHPPGAVAVDGDVYISDLGGRLYALDAGGGLSWITDALRGQQGSGTDGPVVVGKDGTIYVTVNPLGQDVDLVAVSPLGQISWVFSDPGSWSLAAGPGIGPDGNVYAVFHAPGGTSVGAVSLTPDGVVRWSHVGSPPIYEHGGIGAELAFGPARSGGEVDHLFVTVDGDDDRHVYAFALADGAQAWAVPAAVNDVFEGQTAVAASVGGLVYLTESNGWGLQAFSSADGARLWRYSPGIAAYATNPAAGPDGAGYLGWEAGHLGAVGPDGQERWQYQAPDGSISSSPRVTPDDEFVLMGGWMGSPNLASGWVKGIDTATGALSWQVDFESGATDVYVLPDAPVRITADGRRAYVSAKVSGFPADPKYAFVHAVAIDGVEAAITPRETVVPPGGTLQMLLEVQNFEPTTEDLDVWLALTGPASSSSRTVFGPVPISLLPGERYTVQRALAWPPLSAAVQGPYTLRLLVGEHPDEIAASASFRFQVEP